MVDSVDFNICSTPSAATELRYSSILNINSL